MYDDDAATPRPASARRGAIGPATNGVWCFIDETALVATLARSAIDWVALDAQHGLFDRRSLADVGAALTAAGHPFAVRVSGVDAAAIGYALDVGATTVIVPQVDTPGDARIVSAAAHYPPRGSRSWGPLAPLWGSGAPSVVDAGPQVALMIESARALANVDEIAAVPGVDLLFVGPFDLAISLGVDLDSLLDDPAGPLETVRAAAAAAGIGVGVFAGTPERARLLRRRGFDRVAVTTDTAAVAAGIDAVLDRL